MNVLQTYIREEPGMIDRTHLFIKKPGATRSVSYARSQVGRAWNEGI